MLDLLRSQQRRTCNLHLVAVLQPAQPLPSSRLLCRGARSASVIQTPVFCRLFEPPLSRHFPAVAASHPPLCIPPSSHFHRV
ncbi:uncharacterized protein DS421_14g465960 [Arachis hypogaea]|nr:uncharacterized protein DS421_14g465960 [Arachis hypogaea]